MVILVTFPNIKEKKIPFDPVNHYCVINHIYCIHNQCYIYILGNFESNNLVLCKQTNENEKKKKRSFLNIHDLNTISLTNDWYE